MSLPKWVHDAFGRSFECSDGEKLEQAFAIAWEALSTDGSGNTHAPNEGGCSTCQAMRRITDLGAGKEP